MPRQNFTHLAALDANQIAAMRREISGETPKSRRQETQRHEAARAAGEAARHEAASDRLVAAMRRARGI